MAEVEKGKIIGELKDFYKKIRIYYNRQRKRDKGGFTEAQDRNLNALRLELQRDYGRLSTTLSKYGGKAHTPISGKYVDAFNVALQSLIMEPWDFEALDGAIIVVNQAIGKLESIPVAELEKPQNDRDIKPVKAFISHGKESAALRKLREFIETLGIEPLIAKEQPSLDKTVNEKVNYYLGQADFVVILATGDDEFENKLHPRQNVIHEIGLAQKTHAGKIVYLLEEGAVFPSNINPKVWVRFKQRNMINAFLSIVKELRAYGMLKLIKS